MNKKKVIILVCALVIVIVGVLIASLFIKKNQENDKVDFVMTLDINPSMELEVTKKGKVSKIKALNDDANAIINKDMEGKAIEEVFYAIVKNAKEHHYIESDEIIIIVGMEKNDKTIENKLKDACKKNEINGNVIVPKITEEAKKEAQGYGITPAKAAYIMEVLEGNEDLKFDDLIKKSSRELSEMKESGLYCDHDYTLQGDRCEKAIREEKPIEGQTCPEGSYEFEGKCYEEKPIEETDKFVCREEFELKEVLCIRTHTIDATPVKYGCSSGVAKTKGEIGLATLESGDARIVVCVNEADIIHAVSPCELNDGTEHTSAGGKCYWHRAPVIADGCPGKQLVNGECWDDASGIYVCPGRNIGQTYSSSDALCLKNNNYTEATPSEYSCEAGYTLDGTKCNKTEEVPAEHERVCPEGFTRIDNDRCINKEKTVEKVTGYTCEEGARLENNKCVYYEQVEPKAK